MRSPLPGLLIAHVWISLSSRKNAYTHVFLPRPLAVLVDLTRWTMADATAMSDNHMARPWGDGENLMHHSVGIRGKGESMKSMKRN